MTIYIGHTGKRINSTKRTMIDTITVSNVRLKEPTTIRTPVFLLYNKENGSYKYNVRKCNYLRCDWGYYWIDDIVYVTDDLIEIYCHRDVLATGRDDYIKNYEAYIKYLNYSSSHHVIDDPRFGPDQYMGTKSFNISGSTADAWDFFTDIFTKDPNQATVFIHCKAANLGNIVYAIPYSNFEEFYRPFVSEFINGLTGIDEFFNKTLFGSSFKDNVSGIYLTPLSWSDLSSTYSSSVIDGNSQAMIIGRVTFNLNSDYIIFTSPAYVIYQSIATSLVNIGGTASTSGTNLFHPILQKNGYEWLRGPKYTTVVFQYPGGSIDISSEAFVDSTALRIEVNLNCYTGQFIVKIYSRNVNEAGQPGEILLGMAEASYCLDITDFIHGTMTATDQLSSLGKFAAKSASTLVGAQLNVASAKGAITQANKSGNLAEKDMTKLGSNLESARNSIGTGVIGEFPIGDSPKVNGSISCNGGGWNELLLSNNTPLFQIQVSSIIPELFTTEPTGSQTSLYSEVYNNFAKKFGFPYYKIKKISELTKDQDCYVECVGADVGALQYVGDSEPPTFTYYLTAEELSEINNFMNSGFFYE